MSDIVFSPGAARARRLGLWALLPALALGLFLQSYENAWEWWRSRELFARQVPASAAANLGGAEWKLVSLRRVGERSDGRAVMLLDMEAVVRDPAASAVLPCKLVLEAQDGRRWSPQFLTPSEVNRLPERRGQTIPTCTQALASKPAAGATLRISEGFVLPAGMAGEVRPVLSLPAGRPDYLRFEVPG
ncbi:hypothetical protein QO058_09930 [Bosea vestrisii]|uniref:hypothetical protein n=1 Tax=Bosea vestrisii TaxID=151416 RepID=UPI0024DF54EC|nr:hypothetical protein [Bosea vestrisii]WID98521.1 hypothetical protein QO058_09930 [Bosea vestrisii]